MNILIIKQTSLGDVLHSTVALSIIKDNYPDSEISFLTDVGSYDLIKHNPKIHNFILTDIKKWEKNLTCDPIGVINDIRSVTKELNRKSYDMAFDLQGLSRSAFFLYMAKADKKYIKGQFPFIKGYRNKEGHAIDEIVNVLKLSNMKVKNVSMEIAVSEKEKKAAEVIIKTKSPKGNKIIVVSPFTRWETKDWPLEKYNELIEMLGKDKTIFITGSKENESELDRLVSRQAGQNVHNLSGKIDLLVFAELIKRADILISGEGFPVHVAATFNTPLIVLYGPTSEKRVGPLSSNATIIRSGTCEEAPCYKRKCKEKTCMNDIHSNDVNNIIAKVLR